MSLVALSQGSEAIEVASPIHAAEAVEVSGASSGETSTAATIRTADATEAIATWTMIDGLASAFTAVAAYFAFRAFREARRQADAAERQADEAKRAADASFKQAEASLTALAASEDRHDAQMSAMAAQIRPRLAISGQRAMANGNGFRLRISIENVGPSGISNLTLFAGVSLRERTGELLKETPLDGQHHTAALNLGVGISEQLILDFEDWHDNVNRHSNERHMYNLVVRCELRWADTAGYQIVETFNIEDPNFNMVSLMTQSLTKRRRREFAPGEELPKVGAA